MVSVGPLDLVISIGIIITIYFILLKRNADSLELKKIEPEFGKLNLGGTYVLFQVWSDAASQTLTSVKLAKFGVR